MTRAEKLRLHLEQIIFEDLRKGVRLNAAELDGVCRDATPDQKDRAFARALTKAPLLVNEERNRSERDFC